MLIAGRPPNGREKALGIEFLQSQPPREFALALFNLNAFSLFGSEDSMMETLARRELLRDR